MSHITGIYLLCVKPHVVIEVLLTFAVLNGQEKV